MRNVEEGFPGNETLKMLKEPESIKSLTPKEIERLKVVEEIIKTIEEELDNFTNPNTYNCIEGTEIYVDTDYIQKWFDVYKVILRNRYSNNKEFKCEIQNDSINKNGRYYNQEVLKKSMERHNQVMHIKIPRLKSVNDPLWIYDKTSYRNALTDDRIVELLKTGHLQCELGYPVEDNMIRVQTIDPTRTCARIIKIDDDFITIVPLNNQLGDELIKGYLSNPDNIRAGMRAIRNGNKIEKIITFDIIMK